MRKCRRDRARLVRRGSDETSGTSKMGTKWKPRRNDRPQHRKDRRGQPWSNATSVTDPDRGSTAGKGQAGSSATWVTRWPGEPQRLSWEIETSLTHATERQSAAPPVHMSCVRSGSTRRLTRAPTGAMTTPASSPSDECASRRTSPKAADASHHAPRGYEVSRCKAIEEPLRLGQGRRPHQKDSALRGIERRRPVHPHHGRLQSLQAAEAHRGLIKWAEAEPCPPKPKPPSVPPDAAKSTIFQRPARRGRSSGLPSVRAPNRSEAPPGRL